MVDNNTSFMPTWGELTPLPASGARWEDCRMWLPLRWSLLEHTQQGSGIHCSRLRGRQLGKGLECGSCRCWLCPRAHQRSGFGFPAPQKPGTPGPGPTQPPAQGTHCRAWARLPMWTVRLVDTSCVPGSLRTHQGSLLCVRILGRAGLACSSPPLSKAVPVTRCSHRQSEGGKGKDQPEVGCEPAAGGCQFRHRHQMVLEKREAVTAGSGSA